jgi:hypothetical protein
VLLQPLSIVGHKGEQSCHSQYWSAVARSTSPGCAPYLGTVNRAVFSEGLPKMLQNQPRRDDSEGLVRGNASGTRASAESEVKGKYMGSGIPDRPPRRVDKHRNMRHSGSRHIYRLQGLSFQGDQHISGEFSKGIVSALWTTRRGDGRGQWLCWWLKTVSLASTSWLRWDLVAISDNI